AVSGEIRPDLPHVIRRHRNAPFGLELLHQRSDRGGVSVMEVVQITLEVARHLNVHGWAVRAAELAGLIDAAVHEAGENVVLVRRENELADRQPHPLREITGEDVAEVAGRHAEVDRTGM